MLGKSGSGKTVTSMSILQLLDRKTTTIEGSITLQGRELNGLDDKEIRGIRGKDIAFIMQNPMNSFTPVFTIGNQFVETIRSHTALNKKTSKRACHRGDAKRKPAKSRETIKKAILFQLSGGMLQRVMIAMAACLQPSVIIADEPTTALDVHNQLQVLRHLDKIRSEYGTSILLISHDLGVISEMADDVVVMQHGRIVETANVFELFDNPQHEYTKKLLNARLSIKHEEPITHML
ncbi:ABC transporter ATP-binding protein [Peribacillus frigoritolerans]|nr:ABC transporter ATP-binding protein [Peribacillus frigoritolerans]